MNVVVTGGGTIAPIDDVRHVANVSTGRFSAAIAEACLALGATVWHVHAPSAVLPFAREAALDPLAVPDLEFARLAALRLRWLDAKPRLHLVPLPRGTVADYAERLAGVLRGAPIDVALLAMAVSDFEPEPLPGKISSATDELLIRCRPTPKVIRSVREWSPTTYLVGFKLLSGVSEPELIRAAAEANRVNRADLTVANDLQALRAGRHTLHLVRPGHEVETMGPGGSLAKRLVGRVFEWAGMR